ncbi:MAG: hypothetical protein HY606_08235 [Planctomycetes bacterium]|nr:hypothetical protein [Planctomycetota bacterium]
MKKHFITILFVVLSCAVSLFGGIYNFFVTVLFIWYVSAFFIFPAKSHYSYALSYLCVNVPLFLRFMPVDMLYKLKLYPLYLDPILTISYLHDYDMARGSFSYKYIQIADYFLYQPDILIFCSFYLIAGAVILGIKYGFSLSKTRIIQPDRQEGTAKSQ